MGDGVKISEIAAKFQLKNYNTGLESYGTLCIGCGCESPGAAAEWILRTF